jgi:hypothetical protein
MRVSRHNRNLGWRVPSLQVPDVGGGGGAPTVPSDVTVATPATRWITWGGYGHALASAANYALWKTWGFAGHLGNPVGGSYFSGFGGSDLFIGSDASALSSSYDWQKAYQGLGVASINGGATGLGVFYAKAHSDSSLIAGLNVRVASSTNPTSGSIGDIFNATVRSNFCTQATLWAQGIKYLGGDAFGFDLEYGNWGVPAGKTLAQMRTQYEQLGYELGIALWSTSAFPTMDVYIYDWQAAGSWHVFAGSGGTATMTQVATDYDTRTWFIYGLMRGHMDANATGKINFIDAFFYRGVQYGGATLATALKWNTQGRLSIVSSQVSSAVWTHIAPYFNVSPFSWPGTDGTSFYNGSQQNQPAWTNDLEQYRQFGMGGMRAEFTLNGQGWPGRNSTEGGSGLWAGGNDYLTPSGRITAMQGTVSTSASYSTTAPALSASASGSGSTRTISGTASHAYGIRWVKAYIYPSGTPVGAAMTFNLGGGTATTNINNSYMDYTLTLPGVVAGNYAIVTAYSTLGQEHSTVIAL